MNSIEQNIHKRAQKMTVSKSENKETEALRIDFNEEDSEKFNTIKRLLGIQNKSDVIRFCLNFTFLNYPKTIQPTKRGS